MLEQNKQDRELYEDLGKALESGDQGSAARVLIELLSSLGIKPKAAPGQPPPTQPPPFEGQGQGQGDGPEPEVDMQNMTSRPDPSIANRSSEDLQAENDAYKNRRKNPEPWVKYIDQFIAKRSKKLVEILTDRLAFMKCDEARNEVGHKTGRLTSKSAFRVATEHSEPFARKTKPKAPNSVTLIIAHDVSGSMGDETSEYCNMHQSLCLVHALQALGEVYPGLNVLTVPWASNASCHKDLTVGGITMLDQYQSGTYMEGAFNCIRDHEDYKLAVSNRDAIVGIMITDGTACPRDVDKCKKAVENSSPTEHWCCAVIGLQRWDEATDTYVPRTGGQEHAFGDANTMAFVSVNESIPLISKTIQKVVAKSEARRG